MTRVPVFTDDPGWHGQRLKEAFATRGYEAIFVSIKDCFLSLTVDSAGVVIPSFNALPKLVFVRGVPGGTLQQVIARLDVLHGLEMLGVKVYNSGRAIERTVDKAMTSLMLHHKGIPTPDTWICESRHQAQAIISREISNDSPLVIKPLFGSQGNGVRLLKIDDRLPVPMEAYVDGLYYLQRYIDSGEGTWHDHRVFVIRGKAIGAMVRYGASWVNNVALGGQCEAFPHEGEMAALAEAAASAVDIDYCGVDIIRDRHGKLFVLEVNSIPAWKGLQSVLEVDVAQALVDDCLGMLA